MIKIHCTNLSVSIGNKEILSPLNLSAAKPQLIGLIGPNGAGKSTLLKSMAGVQSFNGRMTIDGIDSKNGSKKQRAQRIAYMPQERQVYWSLTVEEIVGLGRLPHQQWPKILRQQDRNIIHHAMAQMHILPFAQTPFHILSGGQQARVLLARMLAQEAELLLADEPVNGLDPAHQIRLMSTFKDLAAAGRTIIISLHDLNLAGRWCDRLILLNNGECLADGPVQDVLSPDLLRTAYGIEIQQVQTDDNLIIFPHKLANGGAE